MNALFIAKYNEIFYNRHMNEQELTLDYIHGTDVYVYQRKDMFRVNTDTAQLALFMRIKKGERVLDIGTNNGALLLCAARFKPAYLCGIDIQKEACELAEYNMQKQHLNNVDIIHEDFKNFSGDNFDVAICNPPYFELAHTRQGEISMRSLARHEYCLQLNDLFKNSAKCLKDKGRLYMIHQASRLADIIMLADQNHLAVKTLQFVHDQRKQYANTVLIEAVKSGKKQCHVLKPIII